MTNVGTRGARQAREQLIRGLLDRFGPGEKLPAEAVLAKHLGVSRNTLREALEELRVRGAVTRTWGVGTFMSSRPPTINYTLSDLVSINELITSSGRRCTAEHEYLGLASPPPDGRQALGLQVAERCWHTRRRYRADDIPVVFVEEYLRTDVGGVPTDPESVGLDMIAYFDELGRPLSFAEMRLQPLTADDEAARELSTESGSLLLHTRSITITEDGLPVVYSVGTMRPDVLSIRVVRTPPLR